MLRQRTITIFFAVLAVLALVGGGIAAFLPSEIHLSRETIQAKVDEQLPQTKHGVTVERAVINLADNQVHINLWMNGKKFGQSFETEIAAIGVPSFRALKGEFYFTPSNVEIKNTKLAVADKLKSLADRYLPNNQGARNLATDLAPRIESWLKTAAERSAVYVLKRRPVHKLKNDKVGIAAMLFLNRVYVENDILVINFTLWRLTWWVIIAIIALVASVGMVFAAIRHPGLFTFLMISG